MRSLNVSIPPMLPLLLLILVATGSSLPDENIIPLDKNLTWHVAHPSEIDCRYVSQHSIPEWMSSNPVGAREHVFGSVISVDGWLCHKVKLITRCSVTWYLASSESHIIEDMEPSFEECHAQLKKRNEATYENVDFPLPNCGWNADNDEEAVRFTLTKHDVFFDPTSSTLRDSLIPGGSCDSNQVCRTIYKSTIWIAEGKSIFDQCSTALHRELIFRTDGNGSYLPRFYLPGSGVFGKGDFCIGKICNENAVVTSFGESFVVDLSIINAMIKLGINHCAKIRLRLGTRADVKLDKMRAVEDQIGTLQCALVVEKIRSGSKLSPSDLYAIAPKSTGVHPIFKVKNGTLMASQAKYVVAKRPVKRAGTNKCYLGESKQFGMIDTDYWVRVNDHIQMSYGGVLCVDGKWSLPVTSETSASLEEVDARPWRADYHPSNTYDFINGTISTVAETHHDGDNLIHATGSAIESGIRSVGNVFTSFLKTLFLLIPVGCVFVVIFCSWYCCSCVSVRNRRAKKEAQYLNELEAFHTRRRNPREF